MAEKQNIPEIRFEGFTDPWEQRKLGELYSLVSEKNDLTFGRESIISVANMYFNANVNVTDEQYLRTYNVMRLGDIAFEGHSNKEFSHGRFVENYIGDGIVSHIFTVLRPRVPFDVNYWRYAINNEKLMRLSLIRSTKASTMMHDLVPSDFLREAIPTPTLAEQKEIGAFLVGLDHLITLHQRKYDKLCTVKKSMLDKMFPKPGETEPEIRFEGFTDPWEQRKFVDTFAFLGNNTLSRAELSLTEGTCLDIHYGDVLIKYGEVLDAGRERIPHITDDQKASSLSCPPLQDGDVIIADTAEDEAVGRCSELRNIEDKTVYSGLHTMPCRPNEVFAAGYLGFYLNSDAYHTQLLPLMQGIKVISVSRSAIEDTDVCYPSLSEQRAIGSLLSHLDSLITLHQRKLELLRNIKKSLLDRMFV